MKELSDLQAPVEIKRKPKLEAAIQAECVNWMRNRGHWARKFSSISQRSVPDYLFARRVFLDITCTPEKIAKHKIAVEFKREDAPIRKDTGCMSTPAQVEEQEAMRAVGWDVFECNNFEDFKRRVIEIEIRDAESI